MTHAISRFAVPDLGDIPEDIKSRLLLVQKRMGFIPHGFLALAHRPDELRAFMAYHEAVMSKPSGLSAAEKEMIVVATSAANHCLMCVIAHGAVLRLLAKDQILPEVLAVDWTKADLTARQRAMIAFGLKVAQTAHAVTDADRDALLAQGFSVEDVWDIGAIAAFFALSNRMAGLLGLKPNPEHYSMGRA